MWRLDHVVDIVDRLFEGLELDVPDAGFQEVPVERRLRRRFTGSCRTGNQDQALMRGEILHDRRFHLQIRNRRDLDWQAPHRDLGPCSARALNRSAERRVGKEWVRTCRSRWSACPLKKKKS